MFTAERRDRRIVSGGGLHIRSFGEAGGGRWRARRCARENRYSGPGVYNSITGVYAGADASRGPAVKRQISRRFGGSRRSAGSLVVHGGTRRYTVIIILCTIIIIIIIRRTSFRLESG